MCGFDLLKGAKAILPDLGKVLAIDGKAIASYARGKKREEVQEQAVDGRRDVDADFGKKVYRGKKADGTLWEKTMSWFGYRLHLVVDAIYELPMGFEVTRASESEVKVAPGILEQMEQQTPEVLARCEYLLGDRGYDDGKLVKELWDNQGIKPVIDIRNMWRDGEETKLVSGTENIAYNYCGQVYCYCPETNQRREMAYGGFEKGRETLKYRCPARHYGVKCRGMAKCPVKSGIRIPLKEDRRIFTPLARSSYRWEKLYKKRTAVERVNSRLDNVFGFERHFIRGLKKMKLRCTLALIVMLAMALGRIKEQNGENLRSLVEAA